jgi:hypothetical protein
MPQLPCRGKYFVAIPWKLRDVARPAWDEHHAATNGPPTINVQVSKCRNLCGLLIGHTPNGARNACLGASVLHGRVAISDRAGRHSHSSFTLLAMTGSCACHGSL